MGIFEDLLSAFRLAHPRLSGHEQLQKTIELWREMQELHQDEEELEMQANNKIKELQLRATLIVFNAKVRFIQCVASFSLIRKLYLFDEISIVG